MAYRAMMSTCMRPTPWTRGLQVPLHGSKARQVAASAKKKSGSFEDMIKQKNTENKVMIYSKTYCPYCSRAKDLFKQLKVDAKIAELDNIEEGSDIQQALKGITGSGTVPQIFVNGEYIGGCTDVYAMHDKGKLVATLDAAGVRHA